MLFYLRLNHLRKRSLRKTIAWFHLGLFGLLLANNVLFQHVHHLAGGITIVHAHPFPKEKPGAGHHQHTKNEYQLLNALFHAIFLPVALTYSLTAQGSPQFLWQKQDTAIFFIYLFPLFLRGPPILMPIRFAH